MSEERKAEVVEDFMSGVIRLYSDGSIVRADDSIAFDHVFPGPDDFSYKHVEYKDVVMDETTGLWARLYLPPKSAKAKVSLIIYYHGGGFCLVSSATPVVHRACQMWAATLGAAIVSVNYRLSPEHRLPCAYDDSIAALQWVEQQAVVAEGEGADPWLRHQADFSRVFMAGDSAGGNIAHHVGLWASGAKKKMEIKGLILMYPFFGGEERTLSEEENKNSPAITLEQSDMLWRLALPVGSNRDHQFSNPLVEGVATSTQLDLPPMLFVIAGHDLLRDRQLKYCEYLKKRGNKIRVHMCDEEDHGFFFFKMEEPCSLEALRCISDFID